MVSSKHSTPSAGAPEQDAVPDAEVRPSRGVSIVWLVPIVAGVIGIWLAYTTLQDRGPAITITFDSAEGLEAGKTQIKYKDVEVGTVQNVRLSEDLQQIVVTAQMAKEVESYMTDGTRFWVVSPRVSAAGVSGLGTLLSGVYIGADFHPGTPTQEFVGLAEPPVITSGVPGRHFMLRATTRGSLLRGSPLYFRGIEAGQVVDYALADDKRALDIQVFVQEPYDQLVLTDSRFWNASGLRASLTASGVQLETESVQSLLSGGIAFDTPFSSASSEPSPENAVFTLYDSYEAVTQAGYTAKVPYLVYFDESVRGLTASAPVEFRGMRVGTVTDVALQIDVSDDSVRIPVTIEIEPQRIQFSGTDDVERLLKESPHKLMENLVGRGLRAQLQSGNLLTGALLVDLGFHPNAAPATLVENGKYPAIPSVPSEIDSLTTSVQDVLTELKSLPLNALVGDLRNTVQQVNQLLESPETKGTMEALQLTATQLQALARTIDQQIGPLINQASGVLNSANSMVGPDSQTRYDLNAMLKELAGAARSIRVFADYLERHPEALLRGKAGFASQ